MKAAAAGRLRKARRRREATGTETMGRRGGRVMWRHGGVRGVVGTAEVKKMMKTEHIPTNGACPAAGGPAAGTSAAAAGEGTEKTRLWG